MENVFAACWCWILVCLYISYGLFIHLSYSLLLRQPWLFFLEENDELKMILLQKKRNHLAGYCKLVIYGVLDLSAATIVFKHFNKVELYLRLSSVLNLKPCVHSYTKCVNKVVIFE